MDRPQLRFVEEEYKWDVQRYQDADGHGFQRDAWTQHTTVVFIGNVAFGHVRENSDWYSRQRPGWNWKVDWPREEHSYGADRPKATKESALQEVTSRAEKLIDDMFAKEPA